MLNNFFFLKSCHLWDNVKKYGTARQATDDNIIWRMRFACWINKAADTYSENVILIAFSTVKMVTRTRLSVTFTRVLSLVLRCNIVLHAVDRK
jgi:hypothetical protein